MITAISKAKKLRPVSFLDRLLEELFSIEIRVIRYLFLPFGVSSVVIFNAKTKI